MLFERLSGFPCGIRFFVVRMDEILVHNRRQQLENHFRDFPLGSKLLGFEKELQMIGD
jgi:hypothetical protein